MGGKLILSPRLDGVWELAADYGEVPKGFTTDGATIPRLLWRILGAPVEAQTIGAAVRHDHAYKTAIIPRAEADDRLYGDLRKAGVGVVRAYVFWLGVRAFGWIYYNKKEAR